MSCHWWWAVTNMRREMITRGVIFYPTKFYEKKNHYILILGNTLLTYTIYGDQLSRKPWMSSICCFTLGRRKFQFCHYFPTFELWCWGRLLRVPWSARRSNQSIQKEINPENSLEGLTLELQYFGHLISDEPTHWKRPWYWERLKAGEGGDKGWDG